MTYQRHWLLSWGGTVGNGADIFSNNVRIMNNESLDPDGLDDGAMNSLLDDFLVDIKALFANPDSYISNSVECQYVKFNEIGPDGKYANTSKTYARFLTGTTGTLARFKGTQTPTMPTFVSACITTTTARGRGPGSKGRLFVPQPAAAIGTNGRWAATQTQAMANAYGSFLTAIGDEAGIDTHAVAPAVISNVGAPGPVERITGVRVGDVPDVIRRRKSAMVETYSTANVSTS